MKLLDLTEDASYWHVDTIQRASAYARNHDFNSEEEARAWQLRQLERADQNPMAIAMNRINGHEKNKAIAAATPVVKIKGKFKIGIADNFKPKVLTWDDFEVEKPSLEPLLSTGTINKFDGYRIEGMKEMALTDLHPTEKHALQGNGPEYVANLAGQIKENEFFRGIIVDQEGTILDGHHRYYAVIKHFPMKTIPALVVNVNWGGDSWEDD